MAAPDLAIAVQPVAGGKAMYLLAQDLFDEQGRLLMTVCALA